MSFAPLETELQRPASPKEQPNANWMLELAETAKNNAVLPALNSFLVEPVNACVNVVNGAASFMYRDSDNSFQRPTPVLPKMAEFEVTAAKQGSGAAISQQLFSTAGSFLIYPIVGKFAGKALGHVAEFAPVEFELGSLKLGRNLQTFARDERTAMVLGASAYAGIKDPKQGESRLSNALGTAVGFSAFELGNAKLVDAAAPLINRFERRFQGGIAQTNTESLIQHQQFSTDLGGALSGGLLNALIPAGERLVKGKTHVERKDLSVEFSDPFTPDLQKDRSQFKPGDNPDPAFSQKHSSPLDRPFTYTEALNAFEIIHKPEFLNSKVPPQIERFNQAQANVEQAPAAKAIDQRQMQSDESFFGRSDTVTGIPFWDNLINKIHEKFSPRPLRRTELTEIIRSLPEEDQKLALNLLKASSDFSNSVNLREWLGKLDLDKSTAAYTINPDSAGNFMGYFFKKSTNGYGSFKLNSIDSLIDAYNKDSHSLPKEIVIFDDCSKNQLTAEQRQVLSKIDTVKIVDTGAFERGINLIDMAKGPDSVAKKLKQIIQETRQNKAASSSDAVQNFLNAGQKQALQLGANIEILNPNPNFGREISLFNNVDATGPTAKPSDSEILNTYNQLVKTKSEKQNIWKFLEDLPKDHRALAADLFLQGGQYRSIASQLESATVLHDQVLAKAKSLKINESDIIYVTNADPGGSSHMTTHLYKEANHVNSKQLASLQQLKKMDAAGQLNNKMVVYLDDISGSGDQARDMLERAGNDIPAGKHFVVALLGAFRQGTELANAYLRSMPKDASFIAAKQYEGLFSGENSFFKALPDQQQLDIHKIGGHLGHKQVAAAFANSHMVPDINVGLFEDFARQVLHLPGSY
jgi:hypothetical protein